MKVLMVLTSHDQLGDTGHFALETHAREIAESIRDFLK